MNKCFLFIKSRWIAHRATGTKKNCSWILRMPLQIPSVIVSFYKWDDWGLQGIKDLFKVVPYSELLNIGLLSPWPPCGYFVSLCLISFVHTWYIHWYLSHKIWNTKYSHKWGLRWAVFHLSIAVFKISILFCPEIKRTNAQYYMIPFLKLHESLEMIWTWQHPYSLCQLSRLSYGIIRRCSPKYAFHFHSLVMTMLSFSEDLFSLHLCFD